MEDVHGPYLGRSVKRQKQGRLKRCTAHQKLERDVSKNGARRGERPQEDVEVGSKKTVQGTDMGGIWR